MRFLVAILAKYTAVWVALSLAADRADAVGRESVVRGKKATAFLLEGAESSASAFCIHPDGLFVTNAHALGRRRLGESVKLYLDGRPLEPIDARIVRTDSQRDLAILLAPEGESYTSLPLGDDSELLETAEVTTFGYPFGRDLALDRRKVPSISINTGRITSLRGGEGGIEKIQFDAAVNPGNSGGPLLDDSGDVIGVVVSGVAGSGVNFAIPVSQLRDLMSKPVVAVDIPELDLRKTADPVSVTVRVLAIGGSPEVDHVEFGAGETRVRMDREAGASVYTAKVQLVDGDRREKIRIYARIFGIDRLKDGRLVNRKISVGDKEIELMDVAAISAKVGVPTLEMEDGVVHRGEIKGLDSIVLDTRRGSVKFDPKEADRIELSPTLESEHWRIPYKVIARDKDGDICAEEDGFALLGKSRPSSLGIPAGAISRWGEPQIFKLPGEVFDTAVGSSGSYLVLHLRDLRKAAVFDAKTRSILGFVPLRSTEAIVTASRNHIVAFYPGRDEVSTWSFSDLGKESTQRLPADSRIVGAAMGSGSTRHVIVQRIHKREKDSAEILIVDVLDLKKKRFLINGDSGKGSIVSMFGSSPVYASLSAAHTRDAWTAYPLNKIITLKGGKLTTVPIRYPGWLQMGPDGDRVYSKAGEIYSETGRLIVRAARNHAVISSSLGRIYVTIPIDYTRSSIGRKTTLTPKLYVSEDGPVLKLPVLYDASNHNSPSRSLLGIEKRIFMLPQTDVFAHVPDSLDRLVVYDYSIETELREVGEKYLYVTSPPPPPALIGRAFRHQMGAATNSGPAKFEIESAPDGMTITTAGLLSWKPPASAKGSEEAVIVRVTNSDGEEVFSTIRIYVE